jgi:hypothetical protein
MITSSNAAITRVDNVSPDIGLFEEPMTPTR